MNGETPAFTMRERRSWFRQINVVGECHAEGLPLSQCPGFLMVIMGLVTIGAMVTTYFIAARYTEPEFVALIASGEAIVLLVIGHTTVNSFARVAEANRMKTEFISVTSHQLRTPLTSLKWSLNLLLGDRLGELTPKQRSYLETVKASGDRMIVLVNDLLNVSRIEQGRFGLRPQATNLVQLVREVADEVTALARRGGIEFSVVTVGEIPLIVADAERLRMVIQNLVDNAVKYTPRGGHVTVEMAFAPDRRGGRWVRVSVKDDGMGIPREQQSAVFSKFFRAQNAMRRKTDGSGLGLFIARSIVELHGGAINFHSQEGKGATFWIDLPLKGRFSRKALLATTPGRI